MIKLYVPAITTNKTFVWDGHRKTCKIRIQDPYGMRYSEGEFVLPITSTSLTVVHYSGETEYKVTLTISGDARTYTVTNIQMYYDGYVVSTYVPDTLNVFVIPTPGTYGVSNSVVKRIIFNGKEVYMTKCNKNPDNENYVWAKPYTLTINNIDCSLYGSEVAPERVEEIGGIKEPGDYFGGTVPSLWGQDTNYFTIYHGEVYNIDELVLAESGEPGTPIDPYELYNQMLNVITLTTIGPVNGSVTYSATCTGDPGGSGGLPEVIYEPPRVISYSPYGNALAIVDWNINYLPKPTVLHVEWYLNNSLKKTTTHNSTYGRAEVAVTTSVDKMIMWVSDSSGKYISNKYTFTDL